MDFLNLILPIMLYTLGVILLVVLIILGIRLIQIIDKMENLLNNVEEKVNTLNGAFALISKATNSITLISETMIGTITSFISKIFKKNSKKEEDIYE